MEMNVELLVRLGGVIQLAILSASALVPGVLDWKAELRRLPTLLRQLIWVHGAFIVLVIAGFGIVSVCLAPELIAGTPLARSVCGLVAIFWLARLGIQFFVFDAKPYLGSRLLVLGYHLLTVAFVYLAVVFSVAALR
jgi:hypothetical protein